MTRKDAALWKQWCERRDSGAFEALVAAYAPFVYDFARRVTGQDADAEDLAQEAFLDLATAPVVFAPLDVVAGELVISKGEFRREAARSTAVLWERWLVTIWPVDLRHDR